jgi:transposase
LVILVDNIRQVQQEHQPVLQPADPKQQPLLAHTRPRSGVATYLQQGSVEPGFRFLKDPLFLASSVFLKKPMRIMALGFILVLCLLVYRLAEHRLRAQLAATNQTLSSQTGKHSARPTMRWVFQLFEGIDVLTIRRAADVSQQVLGLGALHTRILAHLGPVVPTLYQTSVRDQ